jgi:hypothetical protein
MGQVEQVADGHHPVTRLHQARVAELALERSRLDELEQRCRSAVAPTTLFVVVVFVVGTALIFDAPSTTCWWSG